MVCNYDLRAECSKNTSHLTSHTDTCNNYTKQHRDGTKVYWVRISHHLTAVPITYDYFKCHTVPHVSGRTNTFQYKDIKSPLPVQNVNTLVSTEVPHKHYTVGTAHVTVQYLIN